MALDTDTLAGLLRPARQTLRQVPPSRGSTPKVRCGRAQANINELECMKALALFGHARVAEISRLVWPRAAYAAQMTNRTLARLQEAGLTLPRRNASGSRSWLITRKGAAWLDERGVPARHTLDLSSVSGSSFAHRTLGTRFLVEQRVAGFNVAGEYQLAVGAMPFAIEPLCKRLGKASDGVYWRRNANGETAVWWTEVENSPKALAEILRVLAVAEHVGTRLGAANVYLAGLTVVADASLSHAQRLLRAANERWGGRDAAARAALESRVQVVLVDLRPPLLWVGHRTCTLLELRQRHRV